MKKAVNKQQKTICELTIYNHDFSQKELEQWLKERLGGMKGGVEIEVKKINKK